MRLCALAQYGWLCLCHYMDLGPCSSLSPAIEIILGQMAILAFTAVSHKKRFKLLTQHVLPGRLLYKLVSASRLQQ